MKNVKLFEEFEHDYGDLTEEQIEFLNTGTNSNRYHKYWKINSNGKIDIEADFLSWEDETSKRLPVSFGKVVGDFTIQNSALLTLEGAPEEVGGNFILTKSKKLKTLKGCPEIIGGDFSCLRNDALLSLKYGPKKVGGNYECYSCESLKSLEGAAEEVGGDFDCDFCESLLTLKGGPKKLEGEFSCANCDNLPTAEFEMATNTLEILKLWFKSGLSFEDFSKQKKGLIASKKFGF